MGTTATSVLEQRLSEQVNDYLQVIVTTAIAANTSIISTNLQAFDGGRDDYFNDWWVYITDKANAAVQRQVSDYATATGTLTVRGANLLTDGANLATIRLHRYNRDLYIRAFNDTSRELFPQLYKPYDIIELVTGNILPNSHFRDWAVSTVPDKYVLQGATIAAVADTTTIRGGNKSMKVTAGADNDFLYIRSAEYQRLLDLQGKTVSFYAWAQGDGTSKSKIEIYTRQADSTAQTLTSTTTSVASRWTLIKLEDQSLNDDLELITIRFYVTTNGSVVYYDNARIIIDDVREYLLPTDIKNGRLNSVKIATRVAADYGADDLLPTDWETIYGWDIVDDGTDKYLRLPQKVTSDRLLRLEGYAPLSTVSAYTDTIEIDGRYVNKFIAYARWKLMEMIEAPVAVKDIGRYETAAAKAYRQYRLLENLTMPQPPRTMNIQGVY